MDAAEMEKKIKELEAEVAYLKAQRGYMPQPYPYVYPILDATSDCVLLTNFKAGLTRRDPLGHLSRRRKSKDETA